MFPQLLGLVWVQTADKFMQIAVVMRGGPRDGIDSGANGGTRRLPALNKIVLPRDRVILTAAR